MQLPRVGLRVTRASTRACALPLPPPPARVCTRLVGNASLFPLQSRPLSSKRNTPSPSPFLFDSIFRQSFNRYLKSLKKYIHSILVFSISPFLLSFQFYFSSRFKPVCNILPEFDVLSLEAFSIIVSYVKKCHPILSNHPVLSISSFSILFFLSKFSFSIIVP